MPFAIPLIGKILAGLASSETSASSATTQKTSTDSSSGASNTADFSQTVDNVSLAAAGAAQQAAHPGKS
jgi:hypothetical protein